jgi:hypothetical protein
MTLAQIEHVDPLALKDILLVLFSLAGLGLGAAGIWVRTRARRIEPQPLEIRASAEAARLERMENNLQTMSDALADHAERIGALESLGITTDGRLRDLGRRLDDLPGQIVTLLRNTRARFDQ